jgi:hypothetical protein
VFGGHFLAISFCGFPARQAVISLVLTAVSREAAMARPRVRGDGGEQDLFRARLDQIINMNHALAAGHRLARAGSAFRRGLFRRAGHAALAPGSEAGAGPS